MKLRKLSCDQFAGIRNRTIDLADGINVVYGQNESGKSTLVSLIEKTLFRRADKMGNTGNDKEFKAAYYPSEKKNGANPGDTIDGRIEFETEEGLCTLEKEWSRTEASCRLITPNAKFKTADTIEDELRKALVYGEGVYSAMLLAPEKHGNDLLRSLLEPEPNTEIKKKGNVGWDAMHEIENTLAKAFYSSDGLGVEEIGRAIDERIEKLLDRYWDVDFGRPKNASERYTRGIKAVTEAYYALEDAKKLLNRIERLEQEVDNAAARCIAADDGIKKLEREESDFSAVAHLLGVRRERRKQLERLREDAARLELAAGRWPLIEQQAAKAKALVEEKRRAELAEKLKKARDAARKLAECEAKLKAAPDPDRAEAVAAREAEQEIARLESKLRGMNVSAVIRMLGGHEAEVRSLLSGEKLDIGAEKLDLTESVSITIPGVMEMQLTPANVDAAAVNAKLAEKRAELGAILGKYSAANAGALEILRQEHNAVKNETDAARMRLENELGGSTLEELERDMKAAGDEPFRDMGQIDLELRAVCRGKDPVKYAAENEAVLKNYEEEYGTRAGLELRLKDISAEILKTEKDLALAEDVPEEYSSIEDPEAHLAMLREQLRSARENQKTVLVEKTRASGELDAALNSAAADPREALEKAQADFNSKKELLYHWLHIKQVFDDLKAEADADPLEDLTKSFSNYIAMISDGGIEPSFGEKGRLTMDLYSGGSLMDETKLSDGTKQTVLLAFRLAVLDHLFPQGGGLIVLDDPFADMDAVRAERACRLVLECAKRHQVIFLTCHERFIKPLIGDAEPIRL